MRLFLVIDETPFYHPGFVADLIAMVGPEDQWVGAAVVTKCPKSNDIELYMRRNWRRLSIREMVRLGTKKYLTKARSLLPGSIADGNPPSVRWVLERNGIRWFAVERNINSPEILNQIRRFAPDVIVSSNSLLFRSELLALPAKCCINRHSALLPAYGGVWPVFQAYAAGDTETGVSVHVMVEGVDEGRVLAQRAVTITDSDALSYLYEKCFSISASVVIDALEKVRRDDLSPISTGRQPSYFSFPTEDDWRCFRARGGRLA